MTNLPNHDPTTGVATPGPHERAPAQSAPAAYALAVEHVTKRYGATTVVDDLTFTVQPGRVTGFLGPNGAGKSTTMKIMLDLASADAGGATIGGRRYRDLPDPAATVGVVLEPNAFHPGRSGRDHLRILATAAGIREERVDDMLAFVDLPPQAADRRVGGYSLGMKQRLSLAGALLGNPPVLVLDEPGNGLDPQGIRALRDVLRSRTADGDTVFVSSHLLSEVEHLADDVVVINRGKLVTTGSLRELQQSTVLVRTTSAETLRDVLIAAGGLATIQAPDTILVRALAIDEIGEQAFRAGIALHELSPHAGSLEELFLGWTGADAGRRSADSTKEVIGL